METGQTSSDAANMVSDQGLHCLHTGLSVQITIKLKASTKQQKPLRNAFIQMIRVDNSTGQKRANHEVKEIDKMANDLLMNKLFYIYTSFLLNCHTYDSVRVSSKMKTLTLF